MSWRGTYNADQAAILASNLQNSMKPSEAGFDGERGLVLQDPSPDYPSGFFIKLLRGKKPPTGKMNLKNKLLWYMPEGKDAILYYVNDGGQTFELDFLPSDNPFPQ